jgi:signal transduction histidine kinase
VLLLSFLFYTYTINNFERSELIRLQGIANHLALQLSGNDHIELMAKYKYKDDIKALKQDSLYDRMHNVLKNAYQANMLKSPIYTLTAIDSMHFAFGVTSQNKPYYRHEYRSAPGELIARRKTSGVISAYKDEFGTWLSAWSALYDSNKNPAAIIMVDERLGDFLNTAQKQIIKACLVALLIFIAMFSILMTLLKQILEKENSDKINLEKSNEENISIKADLIKANDKLIGIDEFRREMITNISHDLRTPLANTIGYLEYLKDSKDIGEDSKKDLVSIAYKEAIRLQQMVSDLFDLSKLESGHLELFKEPFNIYELIQDISQKYEYQILAKHIDLRFDIGDENFMVIGDVKYINRLFQNLLDNAIRHTFESGFILITVKKIDLRVEIKVCNEGDPIAEHDRPYIFERYFKKSGVQGTGLGLSISKKICDLHNSSIRLEVNNDVTSFLFDLPLYQA